MSGTICGYLPLPPNFETFFPEKYKDRLKRLPGFMKMRNSWDSHKRPMLIMLHVFADNFRDLGKWMDMAYQMADPDYLGLQMDFYVDDVWAAFIFNEVDYTIIRSDEGCSVASPPLIYGVSSAGDVFFFGPKSPTLESLILFCGQVVKGKVEEPSCRKSQVRNVDLTTWNELIYASDEDVAVCFYNSQQFPTAVNENIMKSLSGLADCLKQEAVLLFKMDLQGRSAPKKFSVESTPAFFFLQRAQKHNPMQCRSSLGQLSMLRFVAENASEELYCYNRRAHRKLHAELLFHMKDYFNLRKNTNILDERY